MCRHAVPRLDDGETGGVLRIDEQLACTAAFCLFDDLNDGREELTQGLGLAGRSAEFVDADDGHGSDPIATLRTSVIRRSSVPSSDVPRVDPRDLLHQVFPLRN